MEYCSMSALEANLGEKIGYGGFGTVYRERDNEDTCWKIYNNYVVDLLKREMPNPTLDLPKSRFIRLIRKSRKLKYSDGIYDLLYVNGHIVGVTMPFYEGRVLSDVFLNLPLNTKIGIAKQMVRSSEELSDNFIYLTDYKLDNFILCGGTVKMIDIDDCRTHVGILPNPIRNFFAVVELSEVLLDFFRDRDRSVLVPESVSKKLAWDLNKSPYTYKQIYDYIGEKERPRDVLVIDDISELSTAKKFLDYHPADVVFAANIESPSFLDEDYCLRIIDSCAEDGITLYEFRRMQELNSYPSHVTVGDIYKADHEDVKKLRKTL